MRRELIAVAAILAAIVGLAFVSSRSDDRAASARAIQSEGGPPAQQLSREVEVRLEASETLGDSAFHASRTTTLATDAGVPLTPASLGLVPVVLAPGQVADVPAAERLEEALDAIDRFADRVTRLEAERDAQILQGLTDTVRLDSAIAATRRRLAIAELAERSIRGEIGAGR